MKPWGQSVLCVRQRVRTQCPVPFEVLRSHSASLSNFFDIDRLSTGNVARNSELILPLLVFVRPSWSRYASALRIPAPYKTKYHYSAVCFFLGKRTSPKGIGVISVNCVTRGGLFFFPQKRAPKHQEDSCPVADQSRPVVRCHTRLNLTPRPLFR